MLDRDKAIEAIQGALDRERAAGNPDEIIGMSYQFAEALIEMLKEQKQLEKYGGIIIVSPNADKEKVRKRVAEVAAEKMINFGVIRIEEQNGLFPENMVAWSMWAVSKK